jgi:SGNH hydrolase-like domain, acetyltransferase AlgX/Carbohydrate esterase, sialic acid-specific acetylesterase
LNMRIFFSALFMIVLLLPPVAGYVDLPFVPSTATGTAAPGWQPGALGDPDYYAAWQRYFKDRTAPLPWLTTAKRWLDVNVFAMTDSPGVHVGRDGWLYTQASVEDYRKNACGSRPHVHRLITVLQTVSDLVHASGRRFIVSVVPDKSTIYPEFMDAVPREAGCGQSLFDIWREEQTRTPLDDFVSLTPVLQDAKKQGTPLYSRTESSWTSAGAAVAARTLLDALFANRPSPPGDDDLTPRVPGYVPGNGPAQADTDTGQPAQKHLSAVLVYGGPEAGQLLPLLVHRFDRIDLIATDTVPSRNHQENIADYEAVVLMIPEARLADLRIDLDRWCEMLSADTLASAQESIPLYTIHAFQQISIDVGHAPLTIKSMGPHAFFELPALPGSWGSTLRILKLELETPHADQLTWMDDGEPPLTGQLTVRPGEIRHYVALPRRPSVRLRINPGRQAGIFRLSHAVILEFNLGDSSGRAPIRESTQAVIHAPDNTPAAAADAVVHPAGTVASPEPRLTTAGVSPSSEAPAPLPSVVLHDVEEGRIFQRTGRSADIVVSGTYSGTVGSIEARVVRDGNDQTVVPWTVIDSSPKDGIFMGILREVPQGGWYRVAVRAGNRHEALDLGKARWGVGMLVACIGQSNMEEWFHSGHDLKPHPLAGVHRNGQWQAEGLTGNGAIAFANRLIGKLAIPVGLLDYAVNGSGLRREADWGTGYWADQSETGIYRRFIRGVADAGGSVEYVLWLQGEADAARGTISEQQYQATLTAFIEHQVRADIVNGSRLPDLPFLIIGMPKRPIGRDGPHQAVREAQWKVAEETPRCYLAATTLDLKNLGRQHLAPAAYATLGLRAAQTVLFLLDEARYYRGPAVAGARKVNDARIDIRLLQRGGNDFGPPAGITGWQVLSGAASVPIADVVRMDPRTIRIRLAMPAPGPVRLRYLFGAMPDARRPVRDNSSLELPLEPYEQVIR